MSVPTFHPMKSYQVGDDWEIPYQVKGVDLTDVPADDIEWNMVTLSYALAIGNADVTKTMIDPTIGRFTVNVPRAENEDLADGVHYASIRITIDGVRTTHIMGPIYAVKSPVPVVVP